LSVPDEPRSLGFSPFSHEEADTRVIFHAHNAVVHAFSSVVLRTVDIDVVVLAIANYSQIGCSELWVLLEQDSSSGTYQFMKLLKIFAEKVRSTTRTPCLYRL